MNNWIILNHYHLIIKINNTFLCTLENIIKKPNKIIKKEINSLMMKIKLSNIWPVFKETEIPGVHFVLMVNTKHVQISCRFFVSRRFCAWENPLLVCTWIVFCTWSGDGRHLLENNHSLCISTSFNFMECFIFKGDPDDADVIL